MAIEHEEIFDETYQVLLGIKSSLDIPFRSARSKSLELSKVLKDILLYIEGVRLDVVPYRMRRDDQLAQQALTILRSGLEGLIDNPEFRRLSAEMRFRDRPPMRDRIPHQYYDGDPSILDAIRLAILRIDSAREGESGVTEDLRVFRRIVPEQKLAPALFEISEGKLVLSKKRAIADLEDRDSSDRARHALIARGEKIIDALEQSNCDRRVVESVRELQKLLCEQDNIIELALLNLGVERVCRGVATELPDAIVGAIEGHTSGIGMYVAQFPEWRRFSENAALIDLSAVDVARINEAAESAIQGLNHAPQLAHPEVPRTLAALQALIADPKRASKRAAFAVLRTLENLVARVYRLSADFSEMTANRTVDGLSKAASVALVAGLMTLALNATGVLAPVTGKLAETSWMEVAGQIAKKQIEALGKE